ncbi:MAG: nucleotidyltransferase [Bacteroidota bacterium]
MELDKDFREFVGLLNDNRVKYLVVGGYSVAYHGFPRFTGDLDIWINPTLENGSRMLIVLEKFGFGNMGFKANDFMQVNKVIQFGVEPLRIDILTAVDGLESFDEAFEKRNTSKLSSLKINFIGYSDLIINKKASNRLQDQRDVEELSKVNKR